MHHRRPSLRTALMVIVALLVALATVAVPTEAQAAGVPTVGYRVSLSGKGWQPLKRNGVTSGSANGKAQIEALQFKLTRSALKRGNLRCRVHVAGRSWQGWRSVGKTAGFVNRGRVIDAVKIKLTGTLALKYDVIYRVRVGGTGWLGWAKNGEPAGVANGTANIGAIQVKLVAKGQPTNEGNAYLDLGITHAIKLQHYMTGSLSQLDYKKLEHGGCCAMAYAIGISILTKRDVNPTKYFRGGMCWYDDGHMGVYRSGFSAKSIYDNLRAGKPTMVHYVHSRGQHWVLAIGVKSGVDVDNLTYADFIVIDPYFGDERPLTKSSYFSLTQTMGYALMV